MGCGSSKEKEEESDWDEDEYEDEEEVEPDKLSKIEEAKDTELSEMKEKAEEDEEQKELEELAELAEEGESASPDGNNNKREDPDNKDELAGQFDDFDFGTSDLNSPAPNREDEDAEKGRETSRRDSEGSQREGPDDDRRNSVVEVEEKAAFISEDNDLDYDIDADLLEGGWVISDSPPPPTNFQNRRRQKRKPPLDTGQTKRPDNSKPSQQKASFRAKPKPRPPIPKQERVPRKKAPPVKRTTHVINPYAPSASYDRPQRRNSERAPQTSSGYSTDSTNLSIDSYDNVAPQRRPGFSPKKPPGPVKRSNSQPPRSQDW